MYKKIIILLVVINTISIVAIIDYLVNVNDELQEISDMQHQFEAKHQKSLHDVESSIALLERELRDLSILATRQEYGANLEDMGDASVSVQYFPDERDPVSNESPSVNDGVLVAPHAEFCDVALKGGIVIAALGLSGLIEEKCRQVNR